MMLAHAPDLMLTVYLVVPLGWCFGLAALAATCTRFRRSTLVFAGGLLAQLTALFAVWREVINYPDLEWILPGWWIWSQALVGTYSIWRWGRQSARSGQPGATPNGGPATPVGNSGVTEGPPSVS